MPAGLNTALRICILSHGYGFEEKPSSSGCCGKNGRENIRPFTTYVEGIFINNLIPVTLGNFIGGVILIGTVFWFIYLRPDISFLSLNIKSDFPKGISNNATWMYYAE